jgi:hypothetical protein
VPRFHSEEEQMPQRLSAEDVVGIFPELHEIGDPALRGAVAEIWCEIAAEMPWHDIREVPKSARPNAHGTLIDHIRGVTQMALAICDIAQRMQGKPYDRDLLVAACLLHDASKPVESEPVPDTAGKPPARPAARHSKLGKNVQHGVYAAHKILAKGLPLELANLVITHTHHSGVRAKTWEAAALFYADYADTDASLGTSGDKLYIQRWLLGD